MDKLYVYYVVVDFDPAQDTYSTGVRNRLNLVISEDSEAAVTIMKNIVKPYIAQVYTPMFRSNEEAVAVGHGMEVSEFLSDPANKSDYRTLIDLYVNRYNNYYGFSEDKAKNFDLQLWDEAGEVKTLNEYTHGTYKKKESDDSLDTNVYVNISEDRQDEMAGGVAFVGSRNSVSTESGSTTHLSNSVLISDAIIDTNEAGHCVTSNMQSKLTAAGEILVRTYSEKDQQWSEWTLSPIFVEEAPIDGNTYIRKDASWHVINYDKIPTAGSDNLVRSRHIKEYVDKAVTKVYRYMGSKTVAELSAITEHDIGDVYNMIDSGFVVTGDISVQVHAGDNVVWSGDKWDDLAGIVDLVEYVTFSDYASERSYGVVKINEENGIGVTDDGILYIKSATENDVALKQNDTLPLTPYTAEAAVVNSTHQKMADDYNPAILSDPYSGNLPVSYNAVKAFIEANKGTTTGGAVSVDLQPYQKIIDNKLSTDAKTVTGAINEVYDKVDVIGSSLQPGLNIVKLNKMYPISWTFAGSPYCYNAAGQYVPFQIRNYDNNIVDDVHAFEIYVEEECELRCSVSAWNAVSGIEADYLLVSYYYTGNDGEDLDTMTVAENSTGIIGNAGYMQGSSANTITDADGRIIAKWGGDNRNGGSSAGDTKFYEQVIIDLNAITADTLITLYAGWFISLGNGYIHTTFTGYTGSLNLSSFSADESTKQFNMPEDLTVTYHNPTELSCYIPKKVSSGDANNYLTTYAPAFSIHVHHASSESNKCTFTIKQLG